MHWTDNKKLVHVSYVHITKHLWINTETKMKKFSYCLTLLNKSLSWQHQRCELDNWFGLLNVQSSTDSIHTAQHSETRQFCHVGRGGVDWVQDMQLADQLKSLTESRNNMTAAQHIKQCLTNACTVSVYYLATRRKCCNALQPHY